MNCEDCIHNGVCLYTPYYRRIVLQCVDFKDKSMIIELPCKVGHNLKHKLIHIAIKEQKLINTMNKNRRD